MTIKTSNISQMEVELQRLKAMESQFAVLENDQKKLTESLKTTTESLKQSNSVRRSAGARDGKDNRQVIGLAHGSTCLVPL